MISGYLSSEHQRCGRRDARGRRIHCGSAGRVPVITAICGPGWDVGGESTSSSTE